LSGLLLAIPLVYLTSSLQLGKTARWLGLFETPAEINGMPILDSLREIAAQRGERQEALAA